MSPPAGADPLSPPPLQVVERGPVSGTDCGMAGGPLCAPSMVWRSEAVSLTGDDAKIPHGLLPQPAAKRGATKGRRTVVTY